MCVMYACHFLTLTPRIFMFFTLSSPSRNLIKPRALNYRLLPVSSFFFFSPLGILLRVQFKPINLPGVYFQSGLVIATKLKQYLS